MRAPPRTSHLRGGTISRLFSGLAAPFQAFPEPMPALAVMLVRRSRTEHAQRTGAVPNNLALAVDIADAASLAPERPENIVSAAKTLTACHPESDARLEDIENAIRDQCDENLPMRACITLSQKEVRPLQ